MFRSTTSRLVASTTAALMALTATAAVLPTAAQAAPIMSIDGTSSITLGTFPVSFVGDCDSTLSPGSNKATGPLNSCAAEVAPLFDVFIDGDADLNWAPNPDTLTISNAEILIISNFGGTSCILNLHDPIVLSGPNTGPTYTDALFDITNGAIGDYSISEDSGCTSGANGGLNNAIYQALNPDQGSAGALDTTYTATETVSAEFYVSY